MIYVGIDDTDTLDTRGTNHLARALVERLAPRWRCARVLRHQLLVDPRVPYTSHNGSASLVFEPLAGASIDELTRAMRDGMLGDFIDGSDPGLCVAASVPDEVVAFGHRCRREVVRQEEARRLAAAHGLHLEGLGGTEDGVIGALAAIGLEACGDYGRVVGGADHGELEGVHDAATVLASGVDRIAPVDGGADVVRGTVDLVKRLRPNRRGGRTVLFVEPDESGGAWRAVRRD